MADPETRIFCRLDGLTPTAREQKRLSAIQELGLLDAETVAVFDEATQTAAQILDAPICILGILTPDLLLLKSAVGLSRVGLMNQLAQSRQLPRHECFCEHVVDSQQVLAIHDTATNPALASSLLVGYYGIRAYLGAPLITANGQCVGTLAVMDWVPRCFTNKDIEFLAITARWSLSEFERDCLAKQMPTSSTKWLSQSSVVLEPEAAWKSGSNAAPHENLNSLSACLSSTNTIKVKLLTQLTQQLRTPLTSIMGMASVLGRQIYGPLTKKQQEYLDIIHHSGQQLVSLVEEIIALSVLNETSKQLHLMPVDIEMLCQQAINSVLETAQQRQQQIRLSVEPGSRIWILNKDKVRQILYYLLYSVSHRAEVGTEVRIHVSRKTKLEPSVTASLQIAVWISHPWLGEDVPQMHEESSEPLFVSPSVAATVSDASETLLGAANWERGELTASSHRQPTHPVFSNSVVSTAFALKDKLNNTSEDDVSRESLGLLLSCYLAEMHGGRISVQGSLESGCRYIVSLPQLESAEERL